MNPHDNWGAFYDYVYENCFGQFYSVLTQSTIDAITSICPPSGRILDCGAGTGRLAIPLMQAGFDLDCVEQSVAMANELIKKATNLSLTPNLAICPMSEHTGKPVDLVIAVFTVLAYITTEKELEATLKAIASHLEQKGRFFFDLPNPAFFTPVNCTLPEGGSRIVTIHHTDVQNVYTFVEQGNGHFQGQKFAYEDEFNIRFWRWHEVEAILNEFGLHDTGLSFPQFNRTGAEYRLFWMN